MGLLRKYGGRVVTVIFLRRKRVRVSKLWPLTAKKLCGGNPNDSFRLLVCALTDPLRSAETYLQRPDATGRPWPILAGFQRQLWGFVKLLLNATRGVTIALVSSCERKGRQPGLATDGPEFIGWHQLVRGIQGSQVHFDFVCAACENGRAAAGTEKPPGVVACFPINRHRILGSTAEA